MRKMLEEGALEVTEDVTAGFYSLLFLVEKATGGWRQSLTFHFCDRPCSRWRW